VEILKREGEAERKNSINVTGSYQMKKRGKLSWLSIRDRNDDDGVDSIKEGATAGESRQRKISSANSRPLPILKQSDRTETEKSGAAVLRRKCLGRES
jgi:hypothetical protein